MNRIDAGYDNVFSLTRSQANYQSYFVPELAKYLIGAVSVLLFRCAGVPEFSISLELGETFEAGLVHVDGRESVSTVCCTTTIPAGVPLQMASVRITSLPSGQFSVQLRSGWLNFGHDVVEQWFEPFDYVFDQVRKRPELPIDRVLIVQKDSLIAMYRQVNDTEKDFTGGISTLHESFALRARMSATSVAFYEDGRRWTYAEVDLKATAVAHYLVSEGVVLGSVVGVCVPLSVEFVIAVIGVMKAGSAFMPLDVSYPVRRLQAMVDGTSSVLILTGGEGSQVASGLRLSADVAILPVSQCISVSEQKGSVQLPEVGAADTCYVMHTSGSTGAPKPIALCHGGVLNNLRDLNWRFGVSSNDIGLALSSTSFDMSIVELVGLPIAGCGVVIPTGADDKRPSGWVALALHYEVTIWNSAPQLIDLLVSYLSISNPGFNGFPLRLCMTGGDWVDSSLPVRLREFAPEVRFVSLGGATEASIHSTFHDYDFYGTQEIGKLPYGRLLANQRAYILDEYMVCVPVGATGELHLAGSGLAKGYFNLPDATDEKFLWWTNLEDARERVYKTGDLARLRRDGIIELVGRLDHQVKVDGMRVELGEIESVLLQYSGVEQSVAIFSSSLGARPSKLIVFIVVSATFTDSCLRDYAASRLPRHMVPSEIRIIEALPLTPNGKVARGLLAERGLQIGSRIGLASPKPGGLSADADRDGGSADNYPVSEILDVWNGLLGTRNLRAHDNFFAVGGTSMLAIKSLYQIDPRLQLRDMYRCPTAALLAAFVDTLGPEE